MNRQNLIALISIVVIATVIALVSVLSPAKCQFCDNMATLVRKPDAIKVQRVTEWQGREPSEAEMQIVYCCVDCKPLAGGFRTTTWFSLQ